MQILLNALKFCTVTLLTSLASIGCNVKISLLRKFRSPPRKLPSEELCRLVTTRVGQQVAFSAVTLSLITL
jgi:hypothetical protein